MTFQSIFSTELDLLEDSLLEDSDEEEEEFKKGVLLVCVLAEKYLSEKKTRKAIYVRERIEWEKHIQHLAEEGPEAFLRMYRMEYRSFRKLCNIISGKILVNDEMARLRTRKEGITVEIMLHCLLRWLAGGSYLDIRLSAGISPSYFYNSVYKCMDAILDSEELAYKFPSTAKELEEAAQGFELLSTQAAIKGCVACLDGYLLQIKVPSRTETGNVKAYFSGHYQTYGINVQAACDYKCRFVYAATAAPGGANDIAAFRKIGLCEMIQKLPPKKFVVGDNAYICSETLLTPFSGVEKEDPAKDAFNFYLSQLRIRIEQTFGLMTQKWRIL